LKPGAITKAIGLCLTFLFLVAEPTSPLAARPPRVRISRKKIAPGVIHMVIRLRKGPVVIHVVKTDLGGRTSIRPALARGRLPGLERTSAMARWHKAVAAVNGDFFLPSGRPLAAFAVGGELAQTPIIPRANFAVGSNDRATYIGHHHFGVSLEDPRTGDGVSIGRVNAGKPGPTQLALFTPRGGNLELPPKFACSARLRRAGHYRARGEGTLAPFRVAKVACQRKRMARNGGTILAARWSGSRRRAVTSLRKGQRVNLRWRTVWPDVMDTLGGSPVLVRDGRVQKGLTGRHPIFKRAPRTGVGITRTGDVLLVTVDGRRPKYSVGMRLKRFARLFRSLGATWALNLDGGGSTTMAVRGRVVNRPSDGHERPVGSALLVIAGSGRSAGRKHRSHVRHLSVRDPAIESELPEELAAEEIYDAASIGGLSSWMRRQGTVTRELRQTANAFEARSPVQLGGREEPRVDRRGN
jgi:hypothetical protein